MKISVIIPTYNAEKWIDKQLYMLKKQIGITPPEIIVIDSSSSDRTLDIASKHRAKIVSIKKEEFDHGGTRTKAGKIATGDILVYLTQDAIPVNEYTIQNIVKSLSKDKSIGAAYGRQIPYEDHNIFSKHLRLFNYKTQSYIKSIKDKEKFGIKVTFISNSFAAYKRKALEDVNWFPDNIFFGEDQIVGAKLLKAGYKIAYVAEAMVYHSHSYSLIEEFKRYYIVGKFHKEHKWLLEEFGKPEGEGFKYIKSELSFIMKESPVKIPEAVLRTFIKYIGYRIGYLL